MSGLRATSLGPDRLSSHWLSTLFNPQSLAENWDPQIMVSSLTKMPVAATY